MLELMQSLARFLARPIRIADHARQDLKIYVTYVIWWAYVMVLGHFLIAVIRQQWMDPWHVWWAAIYLFVSVNLTWLRMGLVGDAAALYIAAKKKRRDQTMDFIRSWYWNLTFYFGVVFFFFPIGSTPTTFAALVVAYAGAHLMGHTISNSRRLFFYRLLAGIALFMAVLITTFPNIRYQFQGLFAELQNRHVQANISSGADLAREIATKDLREEYEERYERLTKKLSAGHITLDEFNILLKNLEVEEIKKLKTVQAGVSEEERREILAPPPPGDLMDYAMTGPDAEGWYDIQLDGRLTFPEQDTGLSVEPGDIIDFVPDANSMVCALSVPCAGPGGLRDTPEAVKQRNPSLYAQYNLQNFPVQNALYIALVARVGDNGEPFQLLANRPYTVPKDTSGTIQLMSNIRLNEVLSSRDGHRLKVRVRRQP